MIVETVYPDTFKQIQNDWILAGFDDVDAYIEDQARRERERVLRHERLLNAHLPPPPYSA